MTIPSALGLFLVHAIAVVDGAAVPFEAPAPSPASTLPPADSPTAAVPRASALSDVYARYLACDLSYFTGREFEAPLSRGLHALLLGRNDEAERLGLPVEETEYEGTATGFGIPTTWGSTLIARLAISDALFTNVPVLVVDDAILAGLGLEAGLVLGLPEMRLFGSVTVDFRAGKFVMRRNVPRVDAPPDYAILDQKIVVECDLDGARAAGFIDTGSPWTRLFHSERWSPRAAAGHESRTVSWEVAGETRTRQLFRYRVRLPGGLERAIDLSIVPDTTPEHRFRYDALLGNNLWEGRAMTIDFVNRQLTFD